MIVKVGGVVMASIDLVILGIVLEKPQSAYEIQKDVEYHHFSRWTKVSVPSIYRKVRQLSEKGICKAILSRVISLQIRPFILLLTKAERILRS